MSKQKQEAGSGTGGKRVRTTAIGLYLRTSSFVTSANCCSLPGALKQTTAQEPKPVPQLVAFIFLQLC